MTLRGFSKTKKTKYHPLAHDVWWLIRRYGWLFLVGFGGCSVLTWLGTLTVSASETHGLFFMVMPGIESSFLRIFAVLFGILSGFVLFGFLWNRRESRMYLTLGLRRRTLYLTRYLFGAGSILLSITSALLIMYAIRMASFGSDIGGMCFFYALVWWGVLCLLSLLGFTLAVWITVLCGRWMTALLCTSGILAAPYILPASLQMLLRTFLFGSPLGGRTTVSENVTMAGMQNLVTRSRGAGLFTIFSEELPTMALHAEGLRPESLAVMESLSNRFREDHALPLATVLILVGLLIALSSLGGWLFCRRRAEVAGQVYVNPILAYVVAGTLGVGAGGLCLLIPLRFGGIGRSITAAGLFLGGMALATVLVLLLLMQEVRRVTRTLPALGGMVAVSLVLILCLGSGWFGYTGYIPAVEDIQSVQVSYNQNYLITQQFSGATYIMTLNPEESRTITLEKGMEPFYALSFEPNPQDCPVMSGIDEIQTVRAIHQKIIDDGHLFYTRREAEVYGDTAVQAHYIISYTLKSGKVVTRYYDCLTLDTLEATLAIEETDAYRELFGTSHTPLRSDASLWIGDTLCANLSLMDLSEEEVVAFYAALDADLASLTVAERYFPAAEDVLGVIREREETDKRGFAGSYHRPGKEIFHITTAYTHTLAFLEERELTSYFESDYKVKEVIRQPLHVRFSAYDDYPLSYHFVSDAGIDQLDFCSTHENVALSATEWENAIDESLPTTFLSRPGYLLRITVENEEGKQVTVTRFSAKYV